MRNLPILLAFVASAAVAAPSVEIASPGQSEIVRGKLRSVATASAEATEVIFYLDDQPVASASKAPFTIEIDCDGHGGQHLLIAEAHDAAGHATRSVAVAVTVDATPDTGCSSAVGAATFALLALAGALRRR